MINSLYITGGIAMTTKYKLIGFTFDENRKYYKHDKYHNTIELCLYCVNINKKRLKGIEIDFCFNQNPVNNKISSIKFDISNLYRMDFENLEGNEFGYTHYLRKLERRVFSIDEIDSLILDNKYFYLNLKDKIFIIKDKEL